MRYLRIENWIRNYDSFYVTKDDQKISFSDDFIKSEERTTGLGKGIYSTYKYFDTYIWKEDSTNHYYFEWIPKVDENIKEVHFPDSFVCEDKDGYSTIPYMQGLLIPNRYEYDYSHIAFDGQFTSCAAYMPWLSQTNNGKGYIAINETPWDSKYTIDHDDRGTRLQFVWLTSRCDISVWFDILLKVIWTIIVHVRFIESMLKKQVYLSL